MKLTFNPALTGGGSFAYPMRRNVLIFHSGALGDFLMTWPLAMAAGRLFAQSRIVYVTASQKGALSDRLLRLDSIDAETGGWHSLFSDSPRLDDRAQKWLDSAQVLISFVASENDLWSQSIRKLAPSAQLQLLQSKQPEDAAKRLHVADWIAEQLKESNPALHAGMGAILRSIGERGVGGLRDNPSGPIVIHPGSGAARKCWPIERFVELARQLRDTGNDVIATIGEVEREQMPETNLKQLAAHATIVAPKDYLELAEIIQRARCFIGNDTGPTHLAGMCGVKTVALFGTDPTEWRPLGPRVHVIAGDGINSIEVERVVSAVQTTSSQP